MDLHIDNYLLFNWGMMPDNKYDVNNRGPLSTDMIGMNYEYPDGNYATRERIWQEHVDYTKGLLYFLTHDERVLPNFATRFPDSDGRKMNLLTMITFRPNYMCAKPDA